jgi:hypothetical protein
MSAATSLSRWVLTIWCLFLARSLTWGQAPVITAVSPRANERAARPTDPLTVRFSQPLTASAATALQVFSSQQGGRRTQATTPALVSGNTLLFSPATPFRAGEVVHYTVRQQAASVSGALAKPLVGQFTVAAAPATGLFGPGSDPAVGQGPITVVLGDVDGDGDLDLLTANFSGSSVSVRLNNGQGTFGGGSTVALTGNVRSLVLGDMDGDGDLDLLAPDYNNGTGTTVNLRINNGQGLFSGSQAVPVGPGPYGVALGDVDGDGDLDMLATTTAYTGGAVSVQLNNGQGLFSTYQTVPVGANPLNLVVGDVDGDGDLDLLTGNSNANTVSVRLNDGQGLFSGGSMVAVAGSPFSIALGDVDGDYDLDVLTANPGPNGTVSVRLNNGQGSFGGGAEVAVGNTTTGNGCFSVVLGDVEGDGDLDILAANANGGGAGTVLVRLNDGRGLFSGSQNVAVGRAPQGVAVGDVDGDGDLDLLAANSNDNTVSVRLNENTAAGPVAQLIPNLITPNGDGLNERLVLPYPGAGPWALEVYSRWGRSVYRSSDYHNEWGAEAAAGLYYYLLRSPTAVHKGWVEVVR